jgi:hypothetical protein
VAFMVSGSQGFANALRSGVQGVLAAIRPDFAAIIGAAV